MKNKNDKYLFVVAETIDEILKGGYQQSEDDIKRIAKKNFRGLPHEQKIKIIIILALFQKIETAIEEINKGGKKWKIMIMSKKK